MVIAQALMGIQAEIPYKKLYPFRVSFGECSVSWGSAFFMEKTLWDRQTWPCTLSMRSGTWQSPIGRSAGGAWPEFHSFPGIPRVALTPPHPPSNGSILRTAIREQSLWTESDCDLTLSPSGPSLPPQHPPFTTTPPQWFHIWFCNGFGISAGAAFPFSSCKFLW